MTIIIPKGSTLLYTVPTYKTSEHYLYLDYKLKMFIINSRATTAKNKQMTMTKNIANKSIKKTK